MRGERVAAEPDARVQTTETKGAQTKGAQTKGAQTKGAQTRQAILEAAIARFGREGYRSTSVADIARDASVGGTVAYAYFPNKEALFLAAVDDDAAGVIEHGLSSLLVESRAQGWPQKVMFT